MLLACFSSNFKTFQDKHQYKVEGIDALFMEIQ